MIIWVGFLALIIFFLALDLGVFNKEAHQISSKEALGWTSLWVTISLAFSIFIYYAYQEGWVNNPNNLDSHQAVLEYLTGYVIELSLSLDNIFVIAMIFTYFSVPKINQHRVLFWGILGAIVFRALLILVGIVLINQFSWITYFFGALLIYSAFRMLTSGDKEIDPSKNPLVTLISNFFPVTTKYEKDHFFIKKDMRWYATPLFVALIVVETTDILFAVDSIPAIFAVTTDPFLVFSSNIFAILGLRSLYFVLASMLDRFKLLKYSLVFILAFVGIKMILLHYIHLPEWVSLAVIVGALGIGILLSVFQKKKKAVPEQKS